MVARRGESGHLARIPWVQPANARTSGASFWPPKRMSQWSRSGARNEDRRARRQSDGMAEVGERPCRQIREAGGRPMRVSHAVGWFQVFGPTGSAIAKGSERHLVASRLARHHGPRGRSQEEEECRKNQRKGAQDERTFCTHGKTLRRQLRGTLQHTGAKRSGRPTSWRVTLFKQPESWVKGAGRAGPALISAPSAAPSSGNGRKRSAKLARWYLVDAAPSCAKSQQAFSHTATCPTEDSATSYAQSSKRPCQLCFNSFHAQLFCDERFKGPRPP